MIKKLLLVLWAFVMFSPHAMANCNCSQPSADAIPPFLGKAVSIPPNVLIVMDVSGSMSWSAYNYNNSGTYTGTEEGYFDPNAVYSYNKNGTYWYQTNNTPSRCSSKINKSQSYSGSCLNFHYMTRIDLLKWVLTGGKPKHCSEQSASDKNCDPRLSQMDIYNNGSDIMLTTYNGQDVLVPMSRVNDSLLISLANDTQNTKPRIGLEMFSNDVSLKKVYIGDYDVSGNTDPNNPYTNLIRMISAAAPGGSTATGPAMKAALDYFNQGALDIGKDCKGQGYDYKSGFSYSTGTWKDPMYQPCKSDCITKDCSFCSAECANNYIILISDGDWNTGGDPLKPAWYMHNKFSRTLNSTNFTINKVYTVGMFLPTGTGYCGFKALKNVSLYGSTSINSYPTNCSSCSSNCKNTDYDGNYGAYGSYCYTPNPDPTTTNPPTTFSANNASQLKNSLSTIFQDIAKNVSSGSSAAISSASNQGSILLQSVFWPQKIFDNGAKVSWVGKLYGWWLESLPNNTPQIKADNDKNKQLNLSDTTITFGSTNQSTILDQNTPVFEAGSVLLSTSPANRTIYTTTDGKTLTPFDISNVNSISPYFGSLPSYLGSSNQSTNLINYIRGTDLTTGARSRSVTQNGVSGVWKLGDIVYSSPSVMQAIDYTDASKTYNVIFVGANDGMLHAFLLGQPINTYSKDPSVVLCNDNKFSIDASGNVVCSDGNDKVGSELWAFIPKNSLPYLKYLADPNYDSSKHIYFNDLEPFVFRLYTQEGVKTILISGMRFGGCVTPPSDANGAGYSSYYALDVTDPKNPKLLWEFSNPALGFSYSGPAIIKEYNGTANKYFAVFLSGPTCYDGTSSQPLSLFILDLLSGQLLQTITTFGGASYNNAFGGRLFTGGIVDNANSLTKAIPFGISYQDANNNWHGKVFLLNTFENSDYTKWKVVPVTLGMDIGPITAQVATSKCQNIRQYIYFGTGRYFKPTDGTTSPNENIFGVDVTDCIDSTSCTATLTKITPSNQINVSYVPGFSWYIALTDNGERDISDPLAQNTAVTFTTALPTGTGNTTNSLCITGYGGQANVWSLMCGTGAPNTNSSTYLISTSSGGIYAATAGSSNTTGKIGTFSGIPSIKQPVEVTSGTNKGIIIQWLEK